MRRKYKLTQNDSPFTRWLLEQANQHNLTLTELGRRAGLSTGTLRGLTAIAGRQPTLDTCLRLARALDLPYEQVLAVAGLNVSLPDDPTVIDPDRIEIVQLFDRLPSPARKAMLGAARAWSTCLLEQGG